MYVVSILFTAIKYTISDEPISIQESSENDTFKFPSIVLVFPCNTFVPDTIPKAAVSAYIY